LSSAGLPDPPTRESGLWRTLRSLLRTLKAFLKGREEKEEAARERRQPTVSPPRTARPRRARPSPPQPPEAQPAPAEEVGVVVFPLRLDLEPPLDRYVNVELHDPATEEPVAVDRPLRAGRRYEVALDIGPLSASSIVQDPEAFPSQKLPPSLNGHWLEVGLASTSFDVPDRIAHFFLPKVGAGWVCDCEPGGEHTCSPDQRRDQLRLGITAPSEPGPGQFRISIYFERNVVQTLATAADVAAGEDPDPRGGVVAVIDYTLSARLTDLDGLEPRLASVVVNETPGGTHMLVFKGAGDQTLSLSFSEGQLTTAMSEARSLLLDAQVETIGNSRRNRLEAGNRKGPAELRADLTRLAVAGSRYWNALFGVVGDPLEAAGRAKSDVIQIARVPSSAFVFPWAMVYDLPVGAAQAGFTYCPLIEDWDGRAPLVPDDAAECPHADEHRGASNLVCPYGFWGFRYVIEQPASTGNRSAPVTVGASPPSSLIVAESLQLDGKESDRHLGELKRLLPAFAQQRATSRDQVGKDLADPGLELAYFYCHGKDGGSNQSPFLEVGKKDEIPPEQIVAWHRTTWGETPGHWGTTKPLVFLNGCHTAELTPQSPVNFVDSFSQVGASGVVGTEITLDQAMAGEFAEVFFGHFGGDPGRGVGDALRRTRLHFLAKGNVLGLAYVAYCRAELELGAVPA
jgi:hypothetical protein